MHVHELNPKKTLVTLTLFVIIIIIGLLTLSQPRLVYKMDMKQSVDLALNNQGFVDQTELADLLKNPNQNMVLIDIRDTYQYGRGHIPGAENISAVELLSEDNLKRIADLNAQGIKVLLYGNTLAEANGPFMVLQQIGYNNTQVLTGGYQFYQWLESTKGDSSNRISCVPDQAEFNYAEIAKSNGTVTDDDSPAKKPVIIERKKKTKAVAGGC
jgi:rhodanese-related sulfurtransferase